MREESDNLFENYLKTRSGMWTRSFVTRTDDGKGTKRIGLELDTRGFFLRNVRLGVARRMTSCLLVMLIEFQYLKVWNTTKRCLYTGCFVYRVFDLHTSLISLLLTLKCFSLLPEGAPLTKSRVTPWQVRLSVHTHTTHTHAYMRTYIHTTY